MHYSQTWLLTFAAEKLMMRLRVLAFTNILRQAVGWFDDKESSPGCLTTKLARDAPVVKAVGGNFYTRSVSSTRRLNFGLGFVFHFFRPAECEPAK
jgi:ABC-type multidrug transport system fused ATPase/permease subunit